MIQRTALVHINKLLKKKKKWKILDLGCNFDANKYSTHVADVVDFSSFYSGKKKFYLIKNNRLPFKTNFFDFVITSHVIEHVNNINFFLKEIQRVAQKGYIELPTRFEDNIILNSNNIKDHKWMFVFDDVKKELLYCKKKQLISPFISLGLFLRSLRLLFRESCVLELYWEKKIKIKKINLKYKKDHKLNLLIIFNKFVSYNIRKKKLFLIFILIFVIFIINRF